VGFTAEVVASAEAVEVRLEADGLTKRLRFAPDGALTVEYGWDASQFPADAVFAAELSLYRPLGLRCVPEAVIWTFPVATTAKSERGLDETVQGESVTVRWPVRLGGGTVAVS
jgi:hypothetical protein